MPCAEPVVQLVDQASFFDAQKNLVGLAFGAVTVVATCERLGCRHAATTSRPGSA